MKFGSFIFSPLDKGKFIKRFWRIDCNIMSPKMEDRNTFLWTLNFSITGKLFFPKKSQEILNYRKFEFCRDNFLQGVNF